jgi:hypothetical protein
LEVVITTVSGGDPQPKDTSVTTIKPDRQNARRESRIGVPPKLLKRFVKRFHQN